MSAVGPLTRPVSLCQHVTISDARPDEAPPSVEVAAVNRLTASDVASMLSQFPRPAAAKAVTLDLTPLDKVTSGGAALDVNGIALFANVLLTSERRRRLKVILPSDQTALQQLARGGFFFALAQRDGTDVVVTPTEGTLVTAIPVIAELAAWRNRWDPADSTFRSRVWGLAAHAESNALDVVQREFVAFINPHLSVPRDRLVKELNENVAQRWLDRLNAEERLAAAATEAVTELLYNLAAHPFSSITSLPPMKRDIPRDRRFGLVALFTTSGGGGDRLHIVVADTGHGIPATLRPKFKQRDAKTIGDDKELMTRVLSGDLPPYGRGEGRGYTRLSQLVEKFSGSIVLATNGETGIGVTIVASLESSGSPTAIVEPRMDVAGTIAHVTLLLERRSAPAKESGQQELAIAGSSTSTATGG